MVALSTCAVECIADVLCACQSVWLLKLLRDMKIKVKKLVELMIDNKSVIGHAKNPVLHGRNKNIDTKFHFLRNQIHNGVSEVVHGSTHKQLAEALTKAIKTKHFIHVRNGTGVANF